MRKALGAIVLAAGAAAACKSPQQPRSPIDLIVPGILEADRIPGAAIVLGSVEGVTYRRSFGEARRDTIFDLASLTKVVVTTTVAMGLVEEGSLSLDDPLGKHLAAFRGNGLTVRELLTHRTGLPAYLTPKARTPDAIVEEIACLPADRSYRYS